MDWGASGGGGYEGLMSLLFQQHKGFHKFGAARIMQTDDSQIADSGKKYSSMSETGGKAE